MTLHFTPAMQAHLNVLLRYPQMYTIAMSLMANPHQRLSQVRELLPLLPTLQVGHTDDLKLEWSEHRPGNEFFQEDSPLVVSDYRFWISRMTKEDGARVDHEIILEHRYATGWRQKWGWRQFSQGPLRA